MSQPVASPRTNRTGRTSPSSSSSVTVILRHRLIPLPCDAFCFCASLVDVEIHGDSQNLAVAPLGDVGFVVLDVSGAANWTGALVHDMKRDPVTEVQKLLKLERKVLEGVPIGFDEPAHSLGALIH